ncbi:MAG: ATP-binding protein [Patescibacteria group bacterium]|nr:ATP-binding protein [Patescibacteria group bacterium]
MTGATAEIIRLAVLAASWAVLALAVGIVARDYLKKRAGGGRGVRLERAAIWSFSGLVLALVLLGAVWTAVVLVSHLGLGVVLPVTVAWTSSALFSLSCLSLWHDRALRLFSAAEKELHLQHADEQMSKRQSIEFAENVKEMERLKIALLNLTDDLRSEKQAALESKSRLQSVFRGISDGVFVVGLDGQISLVNPVMAGWIGVPPESLVGRPWTDIVSFSDDHGEPKNEFVRRLMAEKVSQPDFHHDLILKTKSADMPVSAAISPVNIEDQQFGTVVVLRDYTREKKLDQAKTEFVSIASHQLRTPLTAINWYMESLLAGDFGELKGEEREALNSILQSSRQMTNLISALLNVARIDIGYLRILSEPASIKEICEEVIRESAARVKEKRLKVDFSADDLPKVPLDRNLMKIVAENLFTNAVRYTPPDGRISVELRHQGDQAILKVTDTGYGVPAKQKEKIFGKLFRADNVTSLVPEGTGLGLYITKSIVSQFGGDIGFDSEEGKGSTFWVSVPLSGVASKEGRQTLVSMP